LDDFRQEEVGLQSRLKVIQAHGKSRRFLISIVYRKIKLGGNAYRFRQLRRLINSSLISGLMSRTLTAGFPYYPSFDTKFELEIAGTDGSVPVCTHLVFHVFFRRKPLAVFRPTLFVFLS